MNAHAQTTRQRSRHSRPDFGGRAGIATSELLLLPDGRLLVHNLTPSMARWLAELNPSDPQLAPRAVSMTPRVTRNPTHELPS
jgi:hypothetical protein